MATGTYQDGGLTLSLEVSGAPQVTTGAGAPGSTPTQEGDIYVDTTNDVSYIAAGTASSADWKLAGASGMSNVIDDTTPQLGGMLDVNGQALGDGTLELITFTETGSAVNHINITNAATAGSPVVGAVGDDANIDLTLSPKGAGNVVIGNFTFDADQSVGAGQDNYVFTYDNGTGLISLEAASGGGGLSNVVEDTTPQLGGHLDGQGYDITSLGTLSMTEQAAANADVAGDGQLWVKTAIPNQLWFTDDAGTDFQISSLAGTETLTNKTINTASNTITVVEADISDLQSYLLAGDNVTVLDGTADRFIYIDSLGDVTELALGASGTYLQSQGATSAPTWSTPAGSGDVSKVGTPADSQIGVWTGDGTIEGDTALTFDTSTDTFTVAASGNINFGAVTVLNDSAGTTTLQNIDALDATTEATIEAAIDTLANLTTVQSLTVTLADAGADAIFGWDDTAGAYENLTAAEVRAVINVEDGADVTDTTNVTSAGALMDSEVTNLAQVKAFDTTDYATAAQGTTADSAMQDLVDDTDPDLGGDLDLNLKGIVQTFTAQTGSSFTIGEIGYVDTTNEVIKADASTEAGSKGLMVMATGTINADASGDFLLFGYYTGLSGLTAGEQFLSTTAGAMTTTKPSTTNECVRKLGYAPTTTTIWFNPSMDYLVI